MFTLEAIQHQRQQFISMLHGLSIETLCNIPHGCNNNIIWNFGHMVVSGYALLYIRSGVNTNFHIPFLEKYKPGSKPEGIIAENELADLKQLALDFITAIEHDNQEGLFHSFQPFTSVTFGIEMKTFEELLVCIFAHDSLHYATAKAYKKFIHQ